MKLLSLSIPLALSLGALIPVATSLPNLAAMPVNAPRLGAKPPSHTGATTYGWSSSNWSGYATTGSSYHSISGQWTVPTVTHTKGSTYSSAWIGIDGYNNSDLIQTGTEQDVSAQGTSYYAWWEILPAAETQISNFQVRPGDQMSASIVNDGNGQWTITLKDVTENESFSTTQAYSGPGTSAEWIMEAPTIGGHVATLADYGSSTFDPGTINGANPGLATQDSGVMVQKRQNVSSPSSPDADTDGFNVAYGSTAPSAPQS